MNKLFRIRFFGSQSDNRKFKTCTELRRSIQNPKWVGLLAIVVTFAMCGAVAQAQQPRSIPRIAYLGSTAIPSDNLDAFRKGLAELGYVEGKTINIESRFAEGKIDRFNDLAGELINLKVSVIVTAGSGATLAASKVTKATPIVMTVVADPVESGFVVSLARPGGNITGLTTLAPELGGKRLQLLTEAVPKVSPVAVLWNPDNPGASLQFNEIQKTAKALNIKLQSLEVKEPSDFEKAFAAQKNQRAGAMIVVRGALTNFHLPRIIDFALKHRLPVMYSIAEAPDAGGLLFYGPNEEDLYRRAAVYVDKILKGAKPADLPVEQPMKFELVFNLKTAKQIGVTIPQSVLYRADRVIR